jgi:hypothetical protein
MGLERVGVNAGIMTAGLISWKKFLLAAEVA